MVLDDYAPQARTEPELDNLIRSRIDLPLSPEDVRRVLLDLNFSKGEGGEGGGGATTAAKVGVVNTDWSGHFSNTTGTVQQALNILDKLSFDAASISVDITGFNKNLDSNDNSVQAALQTLNDLVTGSELNTDNIYPIVAAMLNSPDASFTAVGDPETKTLRFQITTPFTETMKTKLASIENDATRDQTGKEIIDLLEAEAGDNRLDASAIKGLNSGGGGLQTVEHDTTLTGTGASTSPLKVANPKLSTDDDHPQVTTQGVSYRNQTDPTYEYSQCRFLTSTDQNIQSGAQWSVLGKVNLTYKGSTKGQDPSLPQTDLDAIDMTALYDRTAAGEVTTFRVYYDANNYANYLVVGDVTKETKYYQFNIVMYGTPVGTWYTGPAGNLQIDWTIDRNYSKKEYIIDADYLSDIGGTLANTITDNTHVVIDKDYYTTLYHIGNHVKPLTTAPLGFDVTWETNVGQITAGTNKIGWLNSPSNGVGQLQWSPTAQVGTVAREDITAAFNYHHGLEFVKDSKLYTMKPTSYYTLALQPGIWFINVTDVVIKDNSAFSDGDAIRGEVGSDLVKRGELEQWPAKYIAVDASGFDGNLATTDNTVQKVAQKVDDLTVGGGGASVKVPGSHIGLFYPYTPGNSFTLSDQIQSSSPAANQWSVWYYGNTYSLRFYSATAPGATSNWDLAITWGNVTGTVDLSTVTYYSNVVACIFSSSSIFGSITNSTFLNSGSESITVQFVRKWPTTTTPGVIRRISDNSFEYSVTDKDNSTIAGLEVGKSYMIYKASTISGTFKPTYCDSGVVMFTVSAVTDQGTGDSAGKRVDIVRLDGDVLTNNSFITIVSGQLAYGVAGIYPIDGLATSGNGDLTFLNGDICLFDPS